MEKRKPARLPYLDAEWILARVRDDGCGHLIWTGYSQHGNPKARLGGQGPFNVRRAIWKSMMDMEPRRDCIIVAGCEVHNCVEPGCLVQVSQSQKLAGRILPIKHREAIALARRAQSPLDEEAVAAIRSARMAPRHERPTQDELADRLGVHQKTISDIEQGRYWRNYRTPFEGLMR